MSKKNYTPKVLQFADLHGHNYKEFSTIEDGVNTRLKDCAETLRLIKKSADENEVDMIWFAGDLFQLKNNLDNKVIQLIMHEMQKLAEKYPLLLVPGHHDLYMWSSNPVLLKMLEEFSDQVLVVDKPMWIMDSRFFNVPIYAEPCTRKVKELNERLKNLETNHQEGPIFIAHQDMLGMHYGGYVVEQGLDAEFLSHKFRWSFIGHYHHAEKIKLHANDPDLLKDNVVSVGAPLQHNFGDIGEVPGWWIVQLDPDDYHFDHELIDFIPNDSAPRFFNLNLKEDEKLGIIPGHADRDFYRIKIEGRGTPAGLEQIKWKRISHIASGQSRRRTTISFSDKKEDIIEKYVKARAGDLDHKRLIEMGRKYL